MREPSAAFPVRPGSVEAIECSAGVPAPLVSPLGDMRHVNEVEEQDNPAELQR